MAFIDDCLAEARDLRHAQIQEDLHNSLYLDGAADAAFGRLPEYADPVYLEGYCNKLSRPRLNAMSLIPGNLRMDENRCLTCKC